MKITIIALSKVLVSQLLYKIVFKETTIFLLKVTLIKTTVQWANYSALKQVINCFSKEEHLNLKLFK